MKNILTIFIIALLAVSSFADTAELFKQEKQAISTSVYLSGTGIAKVLKTISLYDAGLYLPRNSNPENWHNDIPKILEIHYNTRISSNLFSKATERYIRKNVSGQDYQSIKAKVEKLKSMYLDVYEGDRYALIYHPDSGTTLTLNGRALGTIPGSGFSRAVFSIWLGDKPIAEDLKTQLLNTHRR